MCKRAEVVQCEYHSFSKHELAISLVFIKCTNFDNACSVFFNAIEHQRAKAWLTQIAGLSWSLESKGYPP